MRSSKRSKVIIGALVVITLGAVASAVAEPPALHSAHIDGTSEAKFEASVAALQNGLAPRRRENFEVALAAIWLSKTLGSSGLDLNADGHVDAIDGQLLVRDAQHLLADIQRGDLLASIEAREKYGTYTVADYIKRLDGLGYDQVLDLAGRPSQLPVRPTKPVTPTIDLPTAKAINESVEALKLQQFAAARRVLGTLRLSKLSSYERSKVEQILFNIAYDEGNFAEAREHLQNALNADGLNPEEVSAVLVEIRLLDAKLPDAQTGLLSFPTLR